MRLTFDHILTSSIFTQTRKDTLSAPSDFGRGFSILRAMDFEFETEVIEWRGPAPFLFAPIPQDLSDEIRSVAKSFTYGWGVIPVVARVGETEFKTSLFPKDGRYLVPLKVVVQRAEGVQIGELVRVSLNLGHAGI